MDPASTLTTLTILAPLIVTLGYSAMCAAYPFKACGRCKGAGRFKGFGGFRICRRCTGTGMRLRLGRRFWNAVTRLRRDARTDRTNAQRRKDITGR